MVVVGGGQAGLAIGYFLAEQGRDFTILEAATEPAAAWRERWDSLRLFTSARYDSLPGLPFPGDPDSYPTRGRGRGLPDRLRPALRAAGRARQPRAFGARSATTATSSSSTIASIEADQVVIATGPFQVPFIPPIAEGLGPEVAQLHSTAYRSPQDIRQGPVLVVGGGNTGFQIAAELAALARGPLSIGSRADAAAPAHPRPRPVLVPRQDRR